MYESINEHLRDSFYNNEKIISMLAAKEEEVLNDYCDKLYLSYEVGHTKPAPEIFEFMVNDCNIIPSETLFVDDGASNIHIGKELGFETFQPKNGEDWREEMTAILQK